MNRMKILEVVLILLFFSFTTSFIKAQETLKVGVSKQKKVSSLPKHITAQEGKLFLFADYKDIRKEKIVLYLINNTKTFFDFESQDGDVYVKMEHKGKDDNWVRAQTHVSSWCGNSYGRTALLKPGYYFQFLGYYPSKGTPSIVRFKRYAKNLELVSNVGKGFIKLDEAQKAKTDSMALERADFKFIKDLALGKIKTKEQESNYLPARIYAIELLGYKNFKRSEVITLLKTLKGSNDNKIALAAEEVLNDLILKKVKHQKKIIVKKNVDLTREERLLLAKTRTLTLQPKRLPILVKEKSLSATINYLNSLFKDQHVSLEADRVYEGINISLKSASLPETLSLICDSNKGLSLGDDEKGFTLYEDSDWSISHAVQHGLVTIHGYHSKGSDSPSISLNFINGITWLNLEQELFSDVVISFPNGVVIKNQNDSINFPVTKADYIQWGNEIKEVSAVMHLAIPTVIRSKLVPLKKMTTLEGLTMFSRQWSSSLYKQKNGKYSFSLDISKQENVQNIENDQMSILVKREHSPYDKGTVFILNAEKKRLFGSYSSFNNLKSKYTQIDLNKPHFFLCRAATEFEIIKIPISFKNIKLPDSIWPK